jgi:hypothetical protein
MQTVDLHLNGLRLQGWGNTAPLIFGLVIRHSVSSLPRECSRTAREEYREGVLALAGIMVPKPCHLRPLLHCYEKLSDYFLDACVASLWSVHDA